MANPALLLVKPLLKSIGKQAAKVLGTKAVASGTTAAGFSSLDAVNIMRAAVDKKMLPSVAKSLGMSSKQLEQITKGLRITPARRNAVTGRNYIKNVNRFIQNPQKSIKQYVSKELKRAARKGVNDAVSQLAPEPEKTPVWHSLKLLEGKLQKIDKGIKLPKSIWDNVANIDIDDVYQALVYVEMDLYGDSGQVSETYDFETGAKPKKKANKEQVWLDDEHKGYKRGMLRAEFLDMIEGMLVNGYHTTKVDGIY